jgi:hypothetical protein
MVTRSSHSIWELIIPVAPNFRYQPDVFLLLLPEKLDGISVQPFMSPWGQTDELLCSVSGTLIGRLAADHRCPGSSVIILLPKLDQRRDYPFPGTGAFLQALVTLLRTSPKVQLICERDSDQEMVSQLATLDDVEVALGRLIAYCEGKISECPTFSYSRL